MPKEYNKQIIFKLISIIVILLNIFAININTSLASSLGNSYPKIANFFLPWTLSDNNTLELSKWDFLILDMENQINNPEKIRRIRELNPKIKIIAYITSQEIKNTCYNNEMKLRCELISRVDDSQFLKSSSGNKLSFWPDTSLLNVTNNGENSWSNILPKFVSEKIYSSGMWDGVFYDNVWKDISWFNNGDIDMNRNGIKDDKGSLDSSWKSGMINILSKTKSLTNNNFIIVANSITDPDVYSKTNGRMFETFPNMPWNTFIPMYTKDLPSKTLKPQINIINANTENKGNESYYQKMRFGLSSALLGDGYFSFDFGDKDHCQTWWYDEYNARIGTSVGSPYNISGSGIWRRDFENAISLTNPNEKNAVYVFENEVFEKLKGSQDSKINDGSKINYINLKAKDGIILLKTNQEIINSVYQNGDFIKTFNMSGKNTRAGFFASKDNFFSGAKIMVTDIDKNNNKEILITRNGVFDIYSRDRQKLHEFYPYGKNYKGKINFAIADLNGDLQNEIITGADTGGPHIRIFNISGKVLNQFFAYDKNLRGGVTVATGDVNGDGFPEILTGAPKNSEPFVKIFNYNGVLINKFLVYDIKFRGGVNIASADVSGDGLSEIISSPKSNGGAQIRIFNKNGKVLSQFFAYDKKFKGSTNVSTSDIDNSGVFEILVSTNTF